MQNDNLREPDKTYTERLINQPISITSGLLQKSDIIMVCKMIEECIPIEEDLLDIIKLKYYKLIDEVLPFVENFNVCLKEYSECVSKLETKIKNLTEKLSVRELRMKFYNKK